jgi:hypothetical protein
VDSSFTPDIWKNLNKSMLTGADCLLYMPSGRVVDLYYCVDAAVVTGMAAADRD